MGKFVRYAAIGSLVVGCVAGGEFGYRELLKRDPVVAEYAATADELRTLSNTRLAAIESVEDFGALRTKKDSLEAKVHSLENSRARDNIDSYETAGDYGVLLLVLSGLLFTPYIITRDL